MPKNTGIDKNIQLHKRAHTRTHKQAHESFLPTASLASALIKKMHPQAKELTRALGVPLQLVIIQVGENPSSSRYIKHKMKVAKKLDIEASLSSLSEDIPEEELLSYIHDLNDSPDVHGILLQLPLPEALAPLTRRFLDTISPQKDVDGLGSCNIGMMHAGYQHILRPATALAVMETLLWAEVPLKSAHAVVVGCSHLVGRPVAELLLQSGATVSICHEHTQNLASHTKQADILISATGVSGLITPEMVKKGATVLDVGICEIQPDGTEHLCGDVCPDVAKVAGKLTPVPGGIGAMTPVCLMQNLLEAAVLQEGLSRGGAS